MYYETAVLRVTLFSTGRNHFSLEPNEIIITGTKGIIVACYKCATPLECMILFWLFFFLLGRWQIILIIHSHSETSLTSTSCLLEDHQAENTFVQLCMNINGVFLIMQHSKQYLSYYYRNSNSCLYIGNILKTYVLLYTTLTTKENQPCKSKLLSFILHTVKYIYFLY